MKLATHSWFSSFDCTLENMKQRVIVTFFARHLIVPKKNGGTRGWYEMATQLEKKKVMHKGFCFTFWFGSVWFGEYFCCESNNLPRKKQWEKKAVSTVRD